MRNTFVLIFTLIASFGYSQKSYLPKNLGEKVNSTFDEINPVISGDGKILYFGRINHPDNNYKYDSQDIWYSELQPNGTWSEAIRLDDSINVNRYNAVLSVSHDGSKLLLLGALTKNYKWFKPGLSVITKLPTGGWSKPERLTLKHLKVTNEGANFNAMISDDGSVIMMSSTKRFNAKKNDLWVALKEAEGVYHRPLKLPSIINTRAYSEESPMLGKDNHTLYFASNRKTGKSDRKRDYNIYMTKRTSAAWSDWTEPELLSDTINTPRYEGYFRLNGKNTYAYYVSETNAIGGTDIFVVKLKEERPYIVVTGKIINSVTGEVFRGRPNMTITVNGLAYDSVKINADSGTYRLRLPFGAKFRVSTNLKNFTNHVWEYDATEVNEYTELTQDLYASPWPFVLAKGSFLNKETGLVLPPGANAKVVLNGKIIDSAKVNTYKGTYEVRIPWGKNYSISLSAFKHDPILDTLNLAHIKEYAEVSKNLFGTPEKVVNIVLSGKVIDKKTGKPIDPKIPFNVLVDSMPNIAASINAQTSEYTLNLAPGRGYTVGGKAENYYPVYERMEFAKIPPGTRVIKDLVLAPIEKGVAIRMNNIFFESGRAVLKPASFPELDKLLQFLMENPSISVRIDGHTDNVGKEAENIRLSRWRARSCKLYLESKGVQPERISFEGFGPKKPVANNNTPAGKALNRRVEFVILDK